MCVYRKKDIINHICNMSFQAPNSFEASLCNFKFPGQDIMTCYNHAKAFCVANNRVQTENQNRNENSHSIEDLNNIFISGKRLDSDRYAGRIINSCHGAIEYVWK